MSQRKRKKRTLVILELHHGKNREIRRLFHALDHKLFSLKRVQYAGLDLGHLPLGQYRSLDHHELRKIQSYTK
jgi:23S rRNA pseudouridine2605 synthase